MKLTTIYLTDDLKSKAEKYAKQNAISVSAVMRLALKKFLK